MRENSAKRAKAGATCAPAGIGPEIIDVCLKVLEKVEKKVRGYHLNFEILPAGAAYYLETGVDITVTREGNTDAPYWPSARSRRGLRTGHA